MAFDDTELYYIESNVQGRRYPLFDLATWKNGLAFRKIHFSETGIPVIKIAELNNGIGATTAYTNQTFPQEVHLRRGDLLFSWSGNPFTSIDIFRFDMEEGWLNQHIFKVTPNPEIIDKDYLYYLMKYLKPHFIQIATNKQTTGLGHVTVADMKRISVPVPSRETQRNAVSVLRSIDDKIEVNAKINDNLRQQAQAVFQEWFIENPESRQWRLGTFSELIDGIISGDWGKDAPQGNNSEMAYCIRGADIPEVRAGNKGKMPIRYILPKNYAAKRLVDGDIVVEISGGSPTQSTGRVAAISTFLLDRYEKGMVCTNFCKAVKPLRGYGMFVYHYWQYLYDRKIFFSYENGTTGIKNLDLSGFLTMEPIRIAPLELALRFDSFCKSLSAQVYANGLENEYLASIRDALLPRLISGELDVSNLPLAPERIP